MKADPAQQRLLLDVQDIDNRIRANTHARKAIDAVAQREAVIAEISSLGPAFIAANGLIEDTRAEISRIEDDVRMVDARLAQDIERRDHSSSPKDIAGFEHEIATLTTRKANLEDAELIVMQRLEDAERELADVQSKRAELAAQAEVLEAAIESRISELDAESAALAAERASVTAQVEAELLALYEKQRERYGIGAALLTRGVSGGSGVALTAADLDAVRHAAADDVVLCPESNCILVRTEESGL